MNRRQFIKTSSIILLGNSLYSYEHEEDLDENIPIYDKNINVILKNDELFMLCSIVKKLNSYMNDIGYTEFNITTMIEADNYAKWKYNRTFFTKIEMEFIDRFININPENYGFLGKSPVNFSFNYNFNKKDIIKLGNQYMYKGESLTLYKKLSGNLRIASYSIAPVGYTYHLVGDFDVGNIKLGADNFTNKFMTTPQYKKLVEEGYVKFRYFNGNKEGVRFEPWHIKVV